MNSATSTVVASLQNKKPGFTNKGGRPLYIRQSEQGASPLYIPLGGHPEYWEADF
jgi:hypothetical protein